MTIKPIKTNADYQEMLREVERLVDEATTDEDFDNLDVLATLVHAYESKLYPIGPPDPIAALEYEMEKRGMTRRDLEPILGHSGRVSEILNRQRPLTMRMIRSLHDRLGISAEILLIKYPIQSLKKIAKQTRETHEAEIACVH